MYVNIFLDLLELKPKNKLINKTLPSLTLILDQIRIDIGKKKTIKFKI